MNENCVLNGNGHPRVLESLFYKENSTDSQEISKSIDRLAGLLSKHLKLGVYPLVVKVHNLLDLAHQKKCVNSNN